MKMVSTPFLAELEARIIAAERLARKVCLRDTEVRPAIEFLCTEMHDMWPRKKRLICDGICGKHIMSLVEKSDEQELRCTQWQLP